MRTEYSFWVMQDQTLCCCATNFEVKSLLCLNFPLQVKDVGDLLANSGGYLFQDIQASPSESYPKNLSSEWVFASRFMLFALKGSSYIP